MPASAPPVQAFSMPAKMIPFTDIHGHNRISSRLSPTAYYYTLFMISIQQQGNFKYLSVIYKFGDTMVFLCHIEN